jgi:energy-coupling factor transporter ATP-binding protein EcfA2
MLIQSLSFNQVDETKENEKLKNSKNNVSAMFKNFLKNSLIAHFSDYTYFHQYWKGNIIVLVGNSTSGKTSIIKSLLKIEPARLEDGVDLRKINIAIKSLQKYCPHEVEILNSSFKDSTDIPKAVFSGDRPWKKGVSDENKIEVDSAIHRIWKRCSELSLNEHQEIQESFKDLSLKMLGDAFEASRRGANIILDVLKIDDLAPYIITNKKLIPIRVVLIYCPFYLLSKRMEKRTEEAVTNGVYSDRRLGEYPFDQFADIYGQKEKNQTSLERITLTKATEDFDENFDKRISVPFESQSSLGKERLRANFLEKLGFAEGVDSVEIAPKFPHYYNDVINTAKRSPMDAAKFIYTNFSI